MERKYTYRSLPCNNCTYYISGTDTITGGTGVLEWCNDAIDATVLFEKMHQSGEFSNLLMQKFPHEPEVPVDARHPLQPLIRDKHGVIRFKQNGIISYMFDEGILDLNKLRK